jgi:hypothetical protein
LLQNQANGSHENDGRGMSGGKVGFSIESGWDRQEENNFNGITNHWARQREVSSTASSRKNLHLYDNFAHTLLEDLYSVVNDA